MAGKIRVRRKGYTKRDGTKVEPTTYLIKDRGAPGKGEKTFDIRKGRMTRWAVKLGFITPDQKVSDIPTSEMGKFARKLAREIGEVEARGMFQAQVNLRKREDSVFKHKMQAAVNALKNFP